MKIAEIVCCTGMTPDQVEDQITFSRMEALYSYWKKHPPTHLLVAAYLGIK